MANNGLNPAGIALLGTLLLILGQLKTPKTNPTSLPVALIPQTPKTRLYAQIIFGSNTKDTQDKVVCNENINYAMIQNKEEKSENTQVVDKKDFIWKINYMRTKKKKKCSILLLAINQTSFVITLFFCFLYIYIVLSLSTQEDIHFLLFLLPFLLFMFHENEITPIFFIFPFSLWEFAMFFNIVFLIYL